MNFWLWWKYILDTIGKKINKNHHHYVKIIWSKSEVIATETGKIITIHMELYFQRQKNGMDHEKKWTSIGVGVDFNRKNEDNIEFGSL